MTNVPKETGSVPAWVEDMRRLVLAALAASDQSGRDLRGRLGEAGIKLSGPAFYLQMAAMEADGLVEGRYEEWVFEGTALKERWYRRVSSGPGGA